MWLDWAGLLGGTMAVACWANLVAPYKKKVSPSHVSNARIEPQQMQQVRKSRNSSKIHIRKSVCKSQCFESVD